MVALRQLPVLLEPSHNWIMALTFSAEGGGGGGRGDKWNSVNFQNNRSGGTRKGAKVSLSEKYRRHSGHWLSEIDRNQSFYCHWNAVVFYQWIKNPLSSFKLGFLNIFSCHNLFRSEFFKIIVVVVQGKGPKLAYRRNIGDIQDIDYPKSIEINRFIVTETLLCSINESRSSQQLQTWFSEHFFVP